MSISIVCARDIHPKLLDPKGVVEYFSDDGYADVSNGGPLSLVLDHWGDEDGLVIPGTIAQLLTLHAQIGEALAAYGTPLARESRIA